MKNKGLIIIILIVLVVVGGYFAWQKKANKPIEDNNEVVKIGVILPLTGSASVWGNNALKGIELAQTSLHKTGVDNFELIIEDSKSETKLAVSALEKLITSENIQIVIGDIASSSVLAMSPIAEKNKVVLFSPGASNSDISYAGDYIFRNWQSDALEGKVDAEFVFNKLQQKDASILYVNNAYGTGLKNAFVETFEQLGGKIETEIAFEQDAKEVRTQLQKLKTKGANLVYLPGYPKEMAMVLKQAQSINYRPQFVSTQSFDDPKIIELAQAATNGVIYSVPTPPDSTKKAVKIFEEEYKKMFKTNPGVCSNTGYDALMMLIKEINGLEEFTGTSLKNALYKIDDYQGASGVIKFNKYGDVDKNFSFYIIKNRQKKDYVEGL